MEYKFVKENKESDSPNCSKCAFIYNLVKCNNFKCKGGYYTEISIESKNIEKLRDYIQSKEREGFLFKDCVKDMIEIINED